MTKEWESRISMWINVLKNRLYTPVQELRFSCFTTDEYLTCRQAARQEGRAIREGDRWGKEWQYGWFKSRVTLGDWAAGQRVVLDLNFGGEATLFVNGEAFGTRRADWVSERYHFLVDNWLEKTQAENETVELLAEVYAGHDRPPEVGEATAGPVQKGWNWQHNTQEGRAVMGHCTCGIWNEEAYHLLLEVQVLHDIWKNEQPDALRRGELEQALQDFSLKLDLSLNAEEFQRNVQECRVLLRPYLECVNGSTAPHMYAVGHAHIDLSWLWPIEETRRKCARTLAAQLRHMDEYPEYKMLQSQPRLYEMVREDYPELFEKIKEKVASGQLIPEGSMWVEPDTNIPAGESLIRQILYGKRYFRDTFGVENRILWLPDVFGYTAALPQIMKGCGVDYFATAKIFWTYNGGDPFPYHYFDWKGIDGTSVRSFLHMDYSSYTTAEALMKKWRTRRVQQGMKSMLVAVGYGDGGGGACRDHIENVRLLHDCEGVPRISFEHPAAFFEQAEKEYRAVPEYVGELYFQAHRGTYTSQAKVKRGNRRCEMALREAEMWAAIAQVQRGVQYPKQELEAEWKQLLTNQMHDILPGSCIHRVYERVLPELEQVRASAARIVQNSTAALTEPADALTVFNSLSWQRSAWVKLPDGWTAACGAEGEKFPVQREKDGLYAQVTVPSCASRTLYPAAASPRQQTEVRITPTCMENSCLRVLLNERGELVSVFDKETQTEWAAGPLNALHLYQDTPSHYEAWDLESMRREIPLPESAQITVEAAGPLFGELRVERRLNDSVLTQWIRLEKDSREIIFRTRIDWRETQKMLKAAFPVNISAEELHSEIQYGYVKRPNHSSRAFDTDRFEVCNHKWSALLEQERGCGVLNDCKYGISCTGSTMELTLLKSAIFPDETADKGVQEFTYAFLFWNTPFARSGIVQRAYELNTAVTLAAGAAQTGSRFTVSDPTVVIDCVKIAEDNPNAVVVRAYESMGSRKKVCIKTDLPVVSCFAANMLEEKQEQLPLQQGELMAEFGPFEVKTFLLEYK